MAVKFLSSGAYCTSLVYWSLIVQSLLNELLIGFMLNEQASCNLPLCRTERNKEIHWLYAWPVMPILGSFVDMILINACVFVVSVFVIRN